MFCQSSFSIPVLLVIAITTVIRERPLEINSPQTSAPLHFLVQVRTDLDEACRANLRLTRYGANRHTSNMDETIILSGHRVTTILVIFRPKTYVNRTLRLPRSEHSSTCFNKARGLHEKMWCHEIHRVRSLAGQHVQD